MSRRASRLPILGAAFSIFVTAAGVQAQTEQGIGCVVDRNGNRRTLF